LTFAGELVITLPARGLKRKPAVGGARVLLAAKPTVVKALTEKSRKQLLSQRLPDARFAPMVESMAELEPKPPPMRAYPRARAASGGLTTRDER